MNDRMPVVILLLLFILLFSGIYYASKCIPPVIPELVGENETPPEPEPVPPVFRLHILAHSDRQEDQKAKLMVRDRVLTELFTAFREIYTCEEAVEYTRRHFNQLENKITADLLEKKLNYGVKLNILQEEFPVAYYGEIKLPAGQYWSLNITMGEGKGRNWWCVLYPPLCFMELNDGDTLTVMAEDENKTIIGQRPNLWQNFKEDLRQELKKIIISQ